MATSSVYKRPSRNPIPWTQCKSIGIEAGADQRTVMKAVRGVYVRPTIRARIVKVLNTRGLSNLVPPDPSAP